MHSSAKEVFKYECTHSGLGDKYGNHSFYSSVAFHLPLYHWRQEGQFGQGVFAIHQKKNYIAMLFSKYHKSELAESAGNELGLK